MVSHRAILSQGVFPVLFNHCYNILIDATQSSRLVPPADNHDTTGEVDPSAHGSGPVEVSLAGYPLEIDNYVVDASRDLGGRYAYNDDFNAGCTVGVGEYLICIFLSSCLKISPGYIQNTIGGGARSSAGTAYFDPVQNRTNLHVLLNTRVTRLINTAADGATPAFDTVELGQSLAVTASNEVILSAGAIGTPQILQLSGVGDSNVLSKLGIETVVDLPDVGKNLQDHPMAVAYLQVNSTKGWDDVTRNDTVFAEYLDEWQTSREGLFVDSPANVLAFMRLPDNATIFNQYSDPSPDQCSAHTELIFVVRIPCHVMRKYEMTYATFRMVSRLSEPLPSLPQGTTSQSSSQSYRPCLVRQSLI